MKLNAVLRTAFLMVFAFALMSTPVKSVAQDTKPVPAATAATVPATNPEAATEKRVVREEKESSEEGDNVFRHSSMVKKLANLMHVDVETAARIFEIINFLIIIFAIGIPLFRILPKMLKSRSGTLAKSIDEARAVSIDAQARLAAVEARLSNLGNEIQNFRTQVEQESAGDEQRIKASVAEERERIVQSAGQEIQQATAQAQRTLRQFAADLALEHAIKQLNLNEETDRALIDEFIADVTANANGGKH